MNYYEHHIGDYAEATSHLSILEDGVYSRLIRKYYARERPLPSNLKEAQRLVGAKSKAERAAVEKVLREFFELREDGWHNERCDEDIVRYLEAEPEREARRVNEALRLKRHREERAQLFNELHAAGHAPPWNTGMAQLRALHSLHCSSPATASATPETRFSTVSAVAPATATATPATATHSQSPVPSPQSQIRISPEDLSQETHTLPLDARAGARAGLVWEAWRDVTECDVQAYESWLEYREQAGDPVPPATRIANAKMLGGQGPPEAQRAFVAELIGRQFKRFHKPFHPINGSTHKPRPTAISAEQMEREIAEGLRDATGSVIPR